jgi:thiosulfate reductase cytochrome b subunit
VSEPLKERRRHGAVEIYRHPCVIRITHGINALCLFVLLLSGLQILSAHPALYWGETSRFDQPLVAIVGTASTDGARRGRLQVGGLSVDTTGLVGAVRAADGGMQARTFPSWLTLPPGLDLGAGRLWHFAFAWLLVGNGTLYLTHGFVSGRLRRQLKPTQRELFHLPRSLLEHLRLHRPQGEADRHYNVLQKVAYLWVIGMALPGMLITGLAQSPAMHAWAPWLGDIFGGRQSARTAHVLTALALVGFVGVHLVMVVAAGPVRGLRAILTGWYRLNLPEAKS